MTSPQILIGISCIYLFPLQTSGTPFYPITWIRSLVPSYFLLYFSLPILTVVPLYFSGFYNYLCLCAHNEIFGGRSFRWQKYAMCVKISSFEMWNTILGEGVSWNKISFCSSCCSGTHAVVPAGLELIEIYL